MSGSNLAPIWLPPATADDMLRQVVEQATRPFLLRTDGPKPLEQYQRDPIGFFVQVLAIPEHTIRWSLNAGYFDHEWDGTPEPLVAMLEGLRDWEDVGVEAGTGTQKSFTAAGIVLWFLASWENARCFTFAPKEDQLRLYIWTEIKKLWPRFVARFPSAELTDLCIRMRGGTDDSWGARGYSVAVRAGEQVSTKAAGMHAEHMLLIYEETPGIPPAVIEAGENTATAPHNLRLALGNPDHQLDALHQFCEAHGVKAIRISALDHPNLVSNTEVVPGAVSKKSVERRKRKYGTEGRLYRSRVQGISPAEAAEALIKLEWVKAAIARYTDPVLRLGPKALGVDVANSEAGDEAAIARYEGACLIEVPAFPCPNANDLGFKVTLEMEEQEIDDLHVGIDSVGVGAGAVNKAKERDHYVQALNGGESAREDASEEKFNNLRSQMYWTMREDLRLGAIALPNDPELALDLITPQWKTQNGKIVVESKEDIKKRLPQGRSPNKGDAAVYGNFVRSREPIAEDARPKKRSLKEGIDLEHVKKVELLDHWREALGEDTDEDDELGGSSEYGDVVQEG